MSEAAAGSVDGPAIEAVEVRKTFDHGVIVALDSITLSIEQRAYVALTGPSGCGKSTLLHLLAALDHPDSGRLRVDGQDVARLDDANTFRRERVGLVFQMHNLLPHLDTIANVAIATLGTDLSHHDARERAHEILGRVGMAGFEHRRPPQLSGGERQRVALARALVNRPAILLADEPTGSLDSASKEMVLDLLARLRHEERTTIVVVTHDDEVAAAADRVIHLRDGRVVDG